MAYANDSVAIVFDNGSYNCKAGFAGDDAPQTVFSNVVGRPLYQRHPLTPPPPNDTYIGPATEAHRALLSLSYPITRGVVTDWSAMESLWRYTYTTLSASPAAHPILLTEPLHSPRSNRERAAELCLESWAAPGFHVAIPGYLSVLAAGRNTALAVDVGEGVMHTFVVTEGHTVVHANQRQDFAGADVTEALLRLLTRQVVYLNSAAEKEIVREIKEGVCYVSEDYMEEEKKQAAGLDPKTATTKKVSYTLPDGQEIVLGTERFEAAESLFNPALVGSEARGLHEVVWGMLMKCDIDMRPHLAVNVLLACFTGGTSLTPGLIPRLHKELTALAPPRMRIKIPPSPSWSGDNSRLHHVWVGGSILASLSTFQKMWITREEWDEVGRAVVHRKCFPNVRY
ncbi:hypothetical protein BJY01DRAFT_247684 [Aspergillus pseudoustus]|uniref:Actin family n=1 Tax=Aspergillus pseudoustus TaxID=1810923 RepID=A0ABR4JZE6_9EURO